MRVASKVGNLHSEFGHARPSCSPVIRYVRNGQTVGWTKAMFIAPFSTDGGILICKHYSYYDTVGSGSGSTSFTTHQPVEWSAQWTLHVHSPAECHAVQTATINDWSQVQHKAALPAILAPSDATCQSMQQLHIYITILNAIFQVYVGGPPRKTAAVVIFTEWKPLLTTTSVKHCRELQKLLDPR